MKKADRDLEIAHRDYRIAQQWLDSTQSLEEFLSEKLGAPQTTEQKSLFQGYSRLIQEYAEDIICFS